MIRLRRLPKLGSTLIELSIFLAAWLVMGERVARAEEAPRPTQHRFVVGGGASQILSFKYDYGETWETGLGLRGAYFYRPIGHIDLGASLTVWYVTGIGSIFIPCLSVRPYVSLPMDFAEIGFNLHVGPSIGSYYGATWLGTSVGIGPDFRVAIAGETSLQISVEAAIVGGSYRGERNSELAYKRTPGLALGGWFGLVIPL
jgi:hypothetical protein